MTSEPRWVSMIVAEAMHLDVMRAHGGILGVRDEGALESALAHGRQPLAYVPDSDLAALAAACGYGIGRNHPFHDGNKRSAFMVIAVFLALNGLDIEAPETEVVTAMLDLAAGLLTEDALADWLRLRTVPRRLYTDIEPTRTPSDGG